MSKIKMEVYDSLDNAYNNGNIEILEWDSYRLTSDLVDCTDLGDRYDYSVIRHHIQSWLYQTRCVVDFKKKLSQKWDNGLTS